MERMVRVGPQFVRGLDLRVSDCRGTNVVAIGWQAGQVTDILKHLYKTLYLITASSNLLSHGLCDNYVLSLRLRSPVRAEACSVQPSPVMLYDHKNPGWYSVRKQNVFDAKRSHPF